MAMRERLWQRLARSEYQPRGWRGVEQGNAEVEYIFDRGTIYPRRPVAPSPRRQIRQHAFHIVQQDDRPLVAQSPLNFQPRLLQFAEMRYRPFLAFRQKLTPQTIQ